MLQLHPLNSNPHLASQPVALAQRFKPMCRFTWSQLNSFHILCDSTSAPTIASFAANLDVGLGIDCTPAATDAIVVPPIGSSSSQIYGFIGSLLLLSHRTSLFLLQQPFAAFAVPLDQVTAVNLRTHDRNSGLHFHGISASDI